MQAIADNIAYAQEQFLVALIFTTASVGVWILFRRQVLAWALLFSIPLLLLHPAWTTSAIHGDCGTFKAMASTVASFIAGILMVVQAIIATVFVCTRKRGSDIRTIGPESYAENLPVIGTMSTDNPYAPPQYRQQPKPNVGSRRAGTGPVKNEIGCARSPGS